jgi:hypothetical protein
MGNYFNKESFEDRFNRDVQDSYSEWFSDPAYNRAVTLNFNTNVSLNNARVCVGKLFRNVDRRLLGTRFTKYENERIQGVFLFEHLETNLHAHGLIQVCPSLEDEFDQMFSGSNRVNWSNIWKAGTHCVKQSYDPARFAHYFSKEQRASSAPETMLFLKDFHPNKG